MSSKRRLESLPATKNHQGLGNSEDESDAKIFSVPDSETGQQSSPHIQLKLMRRQPHQGNADGVLVENNIGTTSVTWRSKFSAVLLQRYLHVLVQSARMLHCCIVHLFVSTNSFHKFVPIWVKSRVLEKKTMN